MSEPRSEEDDNSEICSCIWEHVQTFISEETVEADDNLLVCADQEIDDLYFEGDDAETEDGEEEATVHEPVSKCAEAVH